MFFPQLNDVDWVPRLFLTWMLVSLGLPVLILQVRTRDGSRVAAAALLLLGLSVVSMAFAGRPVLSALGHYGGSNSVSLIAGMACAWALGATLGSDGRRRLTTAVLASTSINLVVALLQAFGDLEPYRLPSENGVTGLLGNPVHLAALMSGCVALLAARVAAGSQWWLLGLPALGVVFPFTGSRIGTLAALVAALASGWQLGRKKGGTVVVLLVLGLVAGEALHRLTDEASSSTSTRLAGTQSIQVEQRLDAWSAGVQAAFDRPLGTGPGRFVEASSPRTTPRQAAASPDTDYIDAHNIVIEYVGTTGLLGGLALLVFLVLSIRQSTGLLLIGALAMLMVYLMQPQSLAVTPVIFLLVGAASRQPNDHAIRWLPTAAIAVPAVVVGAILAVGDFTLRQADLDFEIEDGRAAARLLAPWPQPVSKAGQIAFYRATSGPQRSERGLDEAVRRLRAAASRDPALATSWNNLADLQLFRRDLPGATASFERALEANPWSLRANVGLASVAALDGDLGTMAQYVDRASRIAPRSRVEAMVADRVGG